MLERPAVSFGKLMLRERNRLKITLFGGSVTSVWQSEAKGSLTVQRIGSVADEGSGRAVGIGYQIRTRYCFMRRSREEKKKITAIGF